ncbi:MAG: hypothetical protein ACFFGZ_09295 [Candidatus Thorarchaeota archaeon]
MSNDSANKKPKTWTKRAVTALMPPIATSISLLAGLNIVSIAIVTIIIGFLASLYSRRLSVYTSVTAAHFQQDDLAETFENKSNIVIYRAPEGAQLMAFYRILRRPSGYSFHTLRATFGNSNLTVHPIIHANGPFLCFRFSDDNTSYQKNLVWDVPRHLESLILSITQKTPGLELAPATFADLKDLLGIFGLRIKERPSGSFQTSSASDPPHLSRDRSGDLSGHLPKRIIRKDSPKPSNNNPAAARSLSEIARGIFHNQKSVAEENAAIEDALISSTKIGISSNQTISHGSSANNTMIEGTKEDYRDLVDSYEKILASIDSIQGDQQPSPITPTGKRIAGHLLIKDLQEFLKILQNLTGLPLETRDKITAYKTRLNQHFQELVGSNREISPDELWKRIPGAVEMIEEVLGDLLTIYEENYHQTDGTTQIA